MPPYLRLVPASACWKASKISFCFSWAMPIPVSVTTKAIAEGEAPSTGWSGFQPEVTWRTCIETEPCAVNLNAFESRFFKIWCRRFESLTMTRGSEASMSTSNPSPFVSPMW